MAKCFAFVFAFFGIATLALVVARFRNPKLIPPKSDYATFSAFGGKLQAPAAGVLGSAWLVLAFVLFMVTDRQNFETELATVDRELRQCSGTVDSLGGVIGELEVRLDAAPVDTGTTFYKNLRFGLDSPMPQMGDGVTAGLQGTKDSKIDLLVLKGVIGLSFSLGAEFETVAELVFVDYRAHGRFYVKLGNGEVWGINYLGLNRGTQLNQFQFFRTRKT